MSQKSPKSDKSYPRKNLYWNPTDDMLLDHIAREYKREMQLAGIQPLQTNPRTGKEEPNASKIVHFLIMLASGRIKGLEVRSTDAKSEGGDV
jgi:hypothetical protein